MDFKMPRFNNISYSIEYVIYYSHDIFIHSNISCYGRKEMKEEERRMEEMMERERVLAAKELEKAAETERLKKKQQAIEVERQIKENEITREMELAKMAEVCG